MLRALLLALLLLLPAGVQAQSLQDILQTHAGEVEQPGRRSVGVVIDDLVASGLPEAQTFLERWQAREVWRREADGLFFYAEQTARDVYTLIDIATGAAVAEGVSDDGLTQIRPNGGVRRVLGSALVQFQLAAPDPTVRREALDALARDLSADQIPPLQASIPGETDPDILARKESLLAQLRARFGETTEERVAAIRGMAGDLGLETRAVLNQLLATRLEVSAAAPEGNVAEILDPGSPELSEAEAYTLLAEAGLAPPPIPPSARNEALVARIEDGAVAGRPVAELDTEAARDAAYAALAAAGQVPLAPTAAERAAALAAHSFALIYLEPDATVTAAARDALTDIELRVGLAQAADLALDGLSLASIYFLAAIGLAITFGVMGVINMAHGEFIMMGAYTGYVVQLLIPNYTVSILVALPLAFLVTAGAGIAMERLVIRWLYHRPLETLLATFGISIALQQLAKNIFGTQARPLTSPDWLSGALTFNDVVSISYIRIAIFVLALLFLALFLVIMRRTRLGLEVRAVTQNPRMAASMGINPDRINMLTFGLGSGIAGIAGVAIGLYAKVTSELGQDYIVQSFMTVVVGGVGKIWGTLLGAGLIGFLQKGIEWLNPSNTLAAQTYMILFIILFIQYRPKGLVALKGRAAEA